MPAQTTEVISSWLRGRSPSSLSLKNVICYEPAHVIQSRLQHEFGSARRLTTLETEAVPDMARMIPPASTPELGLRLTFSEHQPGGGSWIRIPYRSRIYGVDWVWNGDGC